MLEQCAAKEMTEYDAGYIQEYCAVCEEPFKGITEPIFREGLAYCSPACVDFSKFGAKVKSDVEAVAAPELPAPKYPFEKNVTETMTIPISGGIVTIKLENVKFANANAAEQSFLTRLQRVVDELAEEVAR